MRGLKSLLSKFGAAAVPHVSPFDEKVQQADQVASEIEARLRRVNIDIDVIAGKQVFVSDRKDR